MIIVGMSVIATVVVLQYHHHDPNGGTMPKWVSLSPNSSSQPQVHNQFHTSHFPACSMLQTVSCPYFRYISIINLYSSISVTPLPCRFSIRFHPSVRVTRAHLPVSFLFLFSDFLGCESPGSVRLQQECFSKHSAYVGGFDLTHSFLLFFCSVLKKNA